MSLRFELFSEIVCYFGLLPEIYRGSYYWIMPLGAIIIKSSSTGNYTYIGKRRFLSFESDSFHRVNSDCMEPSIMWLIFISETLKCEISFQFELMQYKRYRVCKLRLFISVFICIYPTYNIRYFKTINYNEGLLFYFFSYSSGDP